MSEQMERGVAYGWTVAPEDDGTYSWSAYKGGSTSTGTAPTRLAAEFAARNGLMALDPNTHAPIKGEAADHDG